MAVSFQGEDGSLGVRVMQVWTCPVHEEPYEDYHCCDCDHCAYQEIVCPTCESGEWWNACDDDGEVLYEFFRMHNMSGLSNMLRDYYVKPLAELMNFESLFFRNTNGTQEAK